ncbi:cytochrome c oxidase subunit 3 [Nocardia miyunensis]|uniref:cytochrome c oxidase subunit 3 n=1 Tax=Nocardia miyunensis TaxID=282684 RepID=UPI000835ECD4|nr:cytochrome c oxidase subunit 3 [Nocardia miyunensis]
MTALTNKAATWAETPPRERHIPGESGLWILLFGDMTVFLILFGVYLHARGPQKALFDHAQETLNRDLGALNTVLLLISSLLVAMAVRAVRGEHRRLAPPLMFGAMACGVGFIAVKAFEYHARIAAGQTPNTNPFYMYYFVLTGLHLAHLIIGLAVLLALSVLARKPELGKMQLAFFEGGACFWHMVDLLWIVIFPLIFLVR